MTASQIDLISKIRSLKIMFTAAECDMIPPEVKILVQNMTRELVDTMHKSSIFYVEDKQTDSLTGTKHLHFWSAGRDRVEFTAEQTPAELPASTYKFTVSIMGGDCGDTDIYAYVKLGDTIAAQAPLTINGYGSWDTAVTEPVAYDGSQPLTVGIYVKASGAGNGAWGKIDDAALNSAAAD